NFLKTLTIVVMVLLNGFLLRALVGVFVWCIVGFLVSSAIGIRLMYPFVRRLMVPKRKTPEGVVKGEFFSTRAVNTKELTWKEAFFEEGWKKFRMPTLTIFGILSIMLTLTSETLGLTDEDITLETVAFIWGGAFLWVILFAPVVVAFFPVIWLTSDSGWLLFDEESHKIISVGEKGQEFIKGLASFGVVLAFVIKATHIFGIVDAMIFMALVLVIAAPPTYLTTVIYFKKFHFKFVKKFAKRLQDYIIPAGDYQVALKIGGMPVKIAESLGPTSMPLPVKTQEISDNPLLNNPFSIKKIWTIMD
ncbi:MAG: hypothetical protein ACFE68_10010, partial [Candidatus Hodarchaeota archaeon]